MSLPNLELLIETQSTQDFPMITQYLNKEIGLTTIKEEDKSYFIKKVDMVDNHYEVPRTMDILTAIEITGSFTEPEHLSTTQESRLSEIYRRIKSIDIEIGGNVISSIDLNNKICEISTNRHFFTIHIPLNKIFYNIGFLPVVALRYHAINIYIRQHVQQHFDYDCYFMGAVLNINIRNTYFNHLFILLYKDFHKYNGSINENRLSIIYKNGIGMSSTNFINSLYFKFDVNIRSRLKYIELKTTNDQLITMIPLSQINFISDYEFILDKFDYKTFLYNTVIIEFRLSAHFEDICYSLITTNYNVFTITHGMGDKSFYNLMRKVGEIKNGDGFEKIPDALYAEKIVPKNDSFCAITHEEFRENDVRIISGCCFSSFRREAIELWFNLKNKKECPCCRIEGGVWWKREK